MRGVGARTGLSGEGGEGIQCWGQRRCGDCAAHCRVCRHGAMQQGMGRPLKPACASRSQLLPPAAPAAPSWCSYAWFAISVKDFKWLEGASMWDWTKAKVGAAGAGAAVHSGKRMHKVMSSAAAVRPSPQRPCTPGGRHSLPTHSHAASEARIDAFHPCPALLCPLFSCCRWASCTTAGATAARCRCRGCTPRRWRRGPPPARECPAPLPPSRPRA